MSFLLHPPTVHFPIALLLIGSLIELGGARWPSWQASGQLMQRIGLWSALLAILTGFISVALAFAALQPHLGWLNAHAALGLGITALYWRLVMGRTALSWQARRRWLILGCALIVLSGWMGGKLTLWIH